MPTFEPPVDNVVPNTVPGFHPANSLLRFYRPGPRGRNVWKLVDGTFTEQQPADDTTVAHLYHGGHIHDLTDDEAADLTAAGYGDYIT